VIHILAVLIFIQLKTSIWVAPMRSCQQVDISIKLMRACEPARVLIPSMIYNRKWLLQACGMRRPRPCLFQLTFFCVNNDSSTGNCTDNNYNPAPIIKVLQTFSQDFPKHETFNSKDNRAIDNK
jgi:hypothetical protein